MRTAAQRLGRSQDRSHGGHGRLVVANRLEHGIPVLVAGQQLPRAEFPRCLVVIGVRTRVLFQERAVLHDLIPLLRQGAPQQVFAVCRQGPIIQLLYSAITIIRHADRIHICTVWMKDVLSSKLPTLVLSKRQL